MAYTQKKIVVSKKQLLMLCVTSEYLENNLEKLTTRLSKEVCTRGKNWFNNQLETKTIVKITNLQEDNHEEHLTA